jgi:predicted nucleic acid-binding protein
MKRYRVYVDTSVVGGCLDEEFARESIALFEAARNGELTLLVSDIIVAELESAPQEVRQLLPGLPPEAVEHVAVTRETEALRDAYISAGIVGRKQMSDAGHVAAATVARADAIVSWNFRHIVHLEKIKSYNAVNFHHGYGVLTILSPKEVISHGYEEEDI